MIKVVHITENPIAGAPINLSEALNKWQGGKIGSRHIAASDRNENRVYKSDLILGESQDQDEEIKNVLAEADIWHFHNFYRNQELFRRYHYMWDNFAPSKRKVWQVHSPRGTTWMDIEEGLRDPRAKHLVIAQYHPREWPECQIVPNVIDITDPLLQPQERVWDRPLRVAFSPSRIGLLGWDNKGYEETVPILRRLVDQRLITAEVIFDRPHAECLERRGQAHIAIDEIVTGSYHLCSLESLSQGCLTFAGLDELQEKTLKDLTGAAWLPWARANPGNLRERLRVCTNDPSGVKLLAGEGRRWMEKYWHPSITTQKFVDIYNSL